MLRISNLGWNDFARAEQDLLAFFDGRGARLAPLGQNGDAAKPQTFTPPVDVFEDDQAIVLTADLPGVEEKDITVSVDKNVLTLKGTRRIERAAVDPKKDSYRRNERAQGAFTRAFTLPPTVDAEQVGAQLKAGVLTLTLPKKEVAQPRQIKIAVAS